RPAKSLGGPVLCIGTIPRPPYHVGVDPMEVEVVELEKTSGIGLRGRHQSPLVDVFWQCQNVLSCGETPGKGKRLRTDHRSRSGGSQISGVTFGSTPSSAFP